MNTAPIKPLKKVSESAIVNFLVGFLGLITLGFAAPYIYKTRNIANLNTMSRVALGSEVEGVKFSANFMYCALFIFWFPLVLFFFGENTIRPFAVPFTLSIPVNAAMPLLGACIVSGLILMGYMLKIIGNIKDRLLQIAKNYGNTEVIKLYLYDTKWYELKTEKLNQKAFNMLVDEHNARLQDPYNSSRQSNVGNDYSDYYRNNEDFSDNANNFGNDYDSTAENPSAATESPFEILGISESASENEIKAAYRQKCILWHPDKLTPEQRNDLKFSKIVNDEMSRINNAYEQIKQRKGWK
jgi:DnaJ-domain-containing protein 1